MSSSLSNGDRIVVSCNGQVLASEVKVAKSILSRSMGLLGTRQLAVNHGLLLMPCGSVHMIGMLYSLDVLFLDDMWKVVALKESLKPFGLALGGGQAKMTLEIPAKTLRAGMVRVGDQVEFTVH